MLCTCCHNDWEKDELYHGLCPDCVEMELSDWKKEIEFIEDKSKSDDFYVAYYFNVANADFDPQLMFVCRKFIKGQLEVYNKETIARLHEYIEQECEEEYIQWLTGH